MGMRDALELCSTIISKCITFHVNITSQKCNVNDASIEIAESTVGNASRYIMCV